MEESPLLNLPNGTLEKILKTCDYGDRQVLRKVSHALRDHVESQPTIFKFVKILVYPNHITFRADIQGSTHNSIDTQYNAFIKDSKPHTQIYRTMKEAFFKNIVQEPILNVFFRDFATFMKLLEHPSSFIEHLQFESAHPEVNTSNFPFRILLHQVMSDVPKRLKVCSISAQVDDELKLVGILGAVDPQYLRTLTVKKCQAEMKPWNFELVQVNDFWQALKSVKIETLVSNIRPFFNFDDVSIHVETLTRNDVALLARTFTTTPHRRRTFQAHHGGTGLAHRWFIMHPRFRFHRYINTQDPEIVCEIEAYINSASFTFRNVARSSLPDSVREINVGIVEQFLSMEDLPNYSRKEMIYF